MVFHVYQVHFKKLYIASSGCSLVIVVEPGKLLPPAIYLVWCLKLQDSFKKQCNWQTFFSCDLYSSSILLALYPSLQSKKLQNQFHSICTCWYFVVNMLVLGSNLCLIVSQYLRTRGKSFFTESVHQQASSILSNIGTWRQISNRKGQIKNIWGQRLDFVYYQKYHSRFSARVYTGVSVFLYI